MTVESQIIHLLHTLRAKYGMTIVFITHNLDLVASICDRVAVLYQGRVQEIQTSAGLFRNPQTPYARELVEFFRSLA